MNLVPGTPVIRTGGLKLDDSSRLFGWVYLGPANGGKRITIAHPSGAVRYVHPNHVKIDDKALTRLCVLAIIARGTDD